jgi:protein required for attachment to host cells
MGQAAHADRLIGKRVAGSNVCGQGVSMYAYYFVIADHAKCDVVRLRDRRSNPVKLVTVINPAGHRPERDLGTDAPGRVSVGSTAIRHAYQARHTLHEHATELYVRSVLHTLEQLGVTEPDAGILVLVAGPALLGVFRRLLPQPQRERVVELPRSFTKFGASALRERLRKFIAEHRRSSFG